MVEGSTNNLKIAVINTVVFLAIPSFFIIIFKSELGSSLSHENVGYILHCVFLVVTIIAVRKSIGTRYRWSVITACLIGTLLTFAIVTYVNDLKYLYTLYWITLLVYCHYLDQRVKNAGSSSL